MRWGRALLGALGVGSVAGAVLVAAGPDADLVQPAVEALGNDYLLAAIPAAVALALVVLGLVVRGLAGIEQATMPDPEGIPAVPAPGSEFDGFVDGPPRWRTHLRGDQPARVHGRLREATVRTVMAVDGVDRERATERVNAGWTDDRFAAAFCAPDGLDAGGVGGRARAALRGRTWAQYGARRAGEALFEFAGVDDPSDPGVEDRLAEATRQASASTSDGPERTPRSRSNGAPEPDQ